MPALPSARLGLRIQSAGAWMAAGCAALLLSASYHLTTPLARAALRDEVNQRVSELIKGRVQLGTVSHFDPFTGRVIAGHVSLFDASGEEVIHGNVVHLRFDYLALAAGGLRFSEVSLTDGRLRLLDPDGDNTPSFVDALQAVDDSPSATDGPGLQVTVDDITVRNVTVEGALLGLENLRLEHTNVDAAIKVEEDFSLSFSNLSGTLTQPYAFRGVVRSAGGAFSANDQIGLHLLAAGDVVRSGNGPTDQLEAEVSFRAPGPERAPELALTVRADPVDLALLDELGFEWGARFRGPFRGTFSLAGPPSKLSLKVNGTSAGGPVVVEGTLLEGGAASLTASTEGLDLNEVMEDAPEIHLVASATLQLPGAEVADRLPTFSLETEAFLYGVYAVPSLAARGTLGDGEIALDSLEAPYAGGHVDAVGRVAFDGRTWLTVRGAIPELARDPNFHRLVPAMRGGLALHLKLQTPRFGESLDDFRATGSATFTRFSYGPVTASSLKLRGTVRGDPQRPGLDLDVEGKAMRVLGQLLGDTDVRIKGQPSGYDTEVVAHSSQPGLFPAVSPSSASSTAPDPDEHDPDEHDPDEPARDEPRRDEPARGHRGRTVRFRGVVETPNTGNFRIREANLGIQIDELDWQGELDHLLVSNTGTVEVGSLEMRHHGQTLRIGGRFGPQPDDSLHQHLEAAATHVAISHLRRLVGGTVPEMRGRLNGTLTADGDITDPRIAFEGNVSEGVIHNVRNIASTFSASYGENQFDVSASTTMGDHGMLSLAGQGFVDTQADDIGKAFENATYTDMTFRAVDLNIPILLLLLGKTEIAGMSVAERLWDSEEEVADDAPLLGTLSGELTFNGIVQAPTLTGSLSIPDLRMSGWPLLQGSTTFDYQMGSLAVGVTASDERGRLLAATGSLSIDLYQLLINPKEALATLETNIWNVTVETSPRRISALPEPLRDLFPESLHPLHWMVHGSATGGSMRTHIKLVADGHWGEDVSHIFCGDRERPTFHAELTVEDKQGRLTGEAKLGEKSLVVLDASAQVPLDEWFLAGRTPTIPEVELTARIPEGDTHRFLGLCNTSDGTVNGEIRISRLFGNDPELAATARARGLRIARTAPFDGTLSLMAGQGRAYLEAEADWEGGKHALVIAQTPMTWGTDQTVPQIPDSGPIRVEGHFNEAPLASLLWWIPGVERVEGELDGSFAILGTQENPRGSGTLHLRGGRLQIGVIGQHLSDLEGTLTLERDVLRFERLTARDIEGTATIQGEVRFAGLFPESANLTIETSKFPIRQEGGVIASVDTRAEVEATVEAEETRIEVLINRLHAHLPDIQNRSVQSIAGHPDVHIVGLSESTSSGLTTPYPIRFRVQTAEPIRVQRNDFEATIITDVTATVRSGALSVRGTAELVGGHYLVFGREFEIEAGTMVFEGGDADRDPQAGTTFNRRTEIDPIVNFVVSHQLTALNTTVTATIDGYLSNPEINFVSDHPECVEKAAVISMLISGACDTPRSTASDVSAFESQTYNVLASLGNFIIQQEVGSAGGEFLPAVSAELSQYGFRFRAKWDLDFLIPNALRGVIRSISFEGVLTAADDDAQKTFEQSVLPGGTLEAAFPYGFFVRFQFDPAGFAGDVNWEP